MTSRPKIERLKEIEARIALLQAQERQGLPSSDRERIRQELTQLRHERELIEEEPGDDLQPG